MVYLNVRLISSPSRQKRLTAIIKRSTQSHFRKATCACLPKYQCCLNHVNRNVPKLQRHYVASIHIICRLYSDNFTKLCKLCKYDTININIIEHLSASCYDCCYTEYYKPVYFELLRN